MTKPRRRVADAGRRRPHGDRVGDAPPLLIGITVDTYGHLSEDTVRTASDAMAAALEQAFETTMAARRDRNATTDAVEPGADLQTGNEAAGQHGGPRGDRTHNPRINSPLLCQLS